MKERIEAKQEQLPELGINENFNLNHFFCSGTFTSLKPISSAVVTEGVKHLMDNGASWLVTDTVIFQQYKPALKNEPFLVCEFYKQDGSFEDGKLKITDGNMKILFEYKYDFSSLPDGIYRFYIVKGGDSSGNSFYTVMLPKEY